ncbi:hypothetical protein EON65_16630 [archaeon]|nr:MAG: hypothetical protein EON65_16630 [archaeon]
MEVNNQFVKDFSMWIKYYLFEQVRNEGKASEGEKHKFSLLSAPTPSRKIKKGYLKKMGNNVKNWKNRYFVVYNQADNYVLVYYEDESMTKEKGRIHCCG